jgi:membrane associated rhomboid family serine protease
VASQDEAGASKREPATGATVGDRASRNDVALSKVFRVAFTDPKRSRYFSSKPTNPFRWFDSGDVTITADDLRVVAKRRRPFWFSANDDRRFPLTSVVNVEAFDNVVSLAISEHGEKPRPVKLWAADAADATAIAAGLPKTSSAGFSPAMAEAAAFSNQLLEVTPNTPVTYGLVAINCVMFVVAGVLVPHSEILVRLGSDFTPLTIGGEWWRLPTSTFLHLGIVHLGFNMWALYANGPLAERIFGNVRFLVIYLFAGLTGSLASFLWHPVVNGAGASGAIFGVFGAMLAFFVRKPHGLPLSVLRAHRTSVIGFVAYNLVNGARFQGIDNAAHLGGLVGGFALGLLLTRPLDPEHRVAGRGLDREAAAAFILVFGGLVSYFLSVGTLHPGQLSLVSSLPSSNTGEPSLPPVQTLWGVRIGETRAEVRHRKGMPLKQVENVWMYNSIDYRHDGEMEVTFVPSGFVEGDQVSIVAYSGDEASAPRELPNIVDATPEQLRSRFGSTYSTRSLGSGWEVEYFRNGVAANLKDGHVRSFGIFDLAEAWRAQRAQGGG